MSQNMFQRATRTKGRLRLGLVGPPGSGKTFSALRIAVRLLKGSEGGNGRIAFIDSEHGSASLYVDEDNPDGGTFDFDVVDLAEWRGKFRVENYLKAISGAKDAGYRVLVIDSLSHAWAGEGGILEFVDSKSGSSFSNGWRDATPKHNRLVDAILSYPGHVIVCLRSKVEYIIEQIKGKSVPKKVGMQPIQRGGIEFEFSVVGDMTQEDKALHITKTRCSALAGGIYKEPGADVAEILLEWLNKGGDAAEPKSDVVPPWSSEEQRAFVAAFDMASAKRDAQGVTYGDFEAFMTAKGVDAATAGEEVRQRWVGSLSKDAAWTKFEAWVHEGDRDDGGEG